MPNADASSLRPRLTSPNLLARVLDQVGRDAPSVADVWRRLTESYAVDLDAVASLLPKAEPEPTWLTARD